MNDISIAKYGDKEINFGDEYHRCDKCGKRIGYCTNIHGSNEFIIEMRIPGIKNNEILLKVRRVCISCAKQLSESIDKWFDEIPAIKNIEIEWSIKL